MARSVAIRQTLEKLPEICRKLIQMRYKLQLTDEEIAAILKMPLGTFKSRIRACLKRLKGLMEEEM